VRRKEEKEKNTGGSLLIHAYFAVSVKVKLFADQTREEERRKVFRMERDNKFISPKTIYFHGAMRKAPRADAHLEGQRKKKKTPPQIGGSFFFLNNTLTKKKKKKHEPQVTALAASIQMPTTNS